MPWPANLTSRQREVLEVLAEGLPDQESAAILGLSHWTIKTNFKPRLFKAFNVHGHPALVAAYWKLKLAEAQA